jgi:hypothetical protein
MAEKRIASVSKAHVLQCVYLGLTSSSEIAKALNTFKEAVERELISLQHAGLVTAGGVIGKKYGLTAEGMNSLGSPRIELTTVRESAVLKANTYTTLSITAVNASTKAPCSGGLIRIISPKVMNVTRVGGAQYEEDPEHNVLDYFLPALNPNESINLIFDMIGTLPGGVVSSKYKLTIQAYVGETLTDKKEIAIHIEEPVS